MSKDSSRSLKPARRYLAMAGIVGATITIFIISQIISIFAIALVLQLLGWNAGQIGDWLTSTVKGQFVAVVSIEAVLVANVWLVLRYTGRSLRSLKIKKLGWSDAKAVLLGFAAYAVAGMVAALLVKLLFPSINLEQTQQIGFETAQGFWRLSLAFVALCVAVPIAEEILFRGVLFSGLKKYSSYLPAALVTAVVFGLAHMEFFSSTTPNWSAAIDTAVFSLVLTWIYQRQKNLTASIALHALKNSIAFIFLFVR